MTKCCFCFFLFWGSLNFSSQRVLFSSQTGPLPAGIVSAPRVLPGAGASPEEGVALVAEDGPDGHHGRPIRMAAPRNARVPFFAGVLRGRDFSVEDRPVG